MSNTAEFKPDSAIVSNCRDCRFAVKDGPVQTGCEAGRLEVLTSRPGVRVELCDDPPLVPEPQTFYVIDGAACMYKRKPSWVGTPGDAREEIRSRIKIKLFVVASGTVEDLARTIGSAHGFSAVGVVPGDNHPPRYEVVSWLRENCYLSWTTDWFLEPRPWPRLIDDALAKCDSVFYTLVRAGTTLPEGLVESIRSAIVDREKAFLALEGDGFTVVQTRAHREIGGNFPVEAVVGGGAAHGVIEKLRHVAVDKGEQYVFPSSEVLGDEAK